MKIKPNITAATGKKYYFTAHDYFIVTEDGTVQQCSDHRYQIVSQNPAPIVLKLTAALNAIVHDMYPNKPLPKVKVTHWLLQQQVSQAVKLIADMKECVGNLKQALRTARAQR